MDVLYARKIDVKLYKMWSDQRKRAKSVRNIRDNESHDKKFMIKKPRRQHRELFYEKISFSQFSSNYKNTTPNTDTYYARCAWRWHFVCIEIHECFVSLTLQWEHSNRARPQQIQFQLSADASLKFINGAWDKANHEVSTSRALEKCSNCFVDQCARFM